MADEQKATKAAPSRRYYIVGDKSSDAVCLVGANAPSQALYRAAARYCNVRIATVSEAVKLLQQGVDLIDPIDEPELPLEVLPPVAEMAGSIPAPQATAGGVLGNGAPGPHEHTAAGVGPLIGDAADQSPAEPEIL